MNLFKKRLAKAAVATTTLGLTMTGVVALSAAPAQALVETNYAFSTAAFGTRVIAGQLGLRSAPTAHSHIMCTRLAGIKRTEKIATVDAPTNNPMLKVGAVTSVSKTYRNLSKDIAAAVTSTNTVASVTLGADGTPKLSIKGLAAKSTAWADRAGKLHTKTDLTTVKIGLTNLPDSVPPELSGPLNDLVGALNGGIDSVFQALRANGGAITIPGLGKVTIGYQYNSVKATSATARASALVVRLFGLDAASAADDSFVTIGRSRARITKDVPAAVFTGMGYGADVSVLAGIAQVGKLGARVLPCEGTNAKVKESNVLGLDLGNAGVVKLGAVSGRAYGKQSPDGRASAWTEGSVAGISLGSGDTKLVIDGIVGRVNLAQNRAGKIVRSNTRGSKILSLSVGGQVQEIPDPGQAIEIPGLAKIEFFVVDRSSNRRIKITAVKITLLDNTAGVSVIRLGNARASLRRY